MKQIKDINDIISEKLIEVNSIISKTATSAEEQLIETIINYIAKAGGKRLRPSLAIMAAECFGSSKEATLKLAAAVELIHTATLLHDDVIDRSLTRRGIETANHLWGDKASILVGDYLFSQAFRLMIEAGSFEALRILAKASSLISKAEVMQLRLIGKVDILIDDYLQIINEKTAVLFAAACESGAISANASDAERSYIREYGINFGLIFQIVDDYLDYFGDESSLGKAPGGDFLEGKVTLPLILLLKKCDSKEFDYLSNMLTESESLRKSELEKVTKLLIKHNVTEEIKIYLNKYIEAATKELGQLPECDVTNKMKSLIMDCYKKIKVL